MKKIIRKFKSLSKKQKIIVLLVLAALIAGAAYYFTKGSKPAEPETPPEPIYSQLMGLEVSQEVADRPILGVMIENHPEARPQSGLSEAGMVFEAVAEGGITRYLVLYQENTPKNLGPIRSVRTYYLDWAMGLDASLAHVGGAADALELIDSRSAKSLSQFKHPAPYHRTNDRYAPHNMYSDFNALSALQKELGHGKPKINPFPRSSDSPSATPDAAKVTINYSYGDFAVEFRYDKTTNTYKRFLAGAPDKDRNNNKQITVKNLVVLKMAGAQSKATGSGTALLHKDGTVQTIRWRQNSFRERIQLVDEQGNEVPLNRGMTWFAAVPSTGTVSH